MICPQSLASFGQVLILIQPRNWPLHNYTPNVLGMLTRVSASPVVHVTSLSILKWAEYFCLCFSGSVKLVFLTWLALASLTENLLPTNLSDIFALGETKLLQFTEALQLLERNVINLMNFFWLP